MPDAGAAEVRREVARQAATLQPEDERDIIEFLEAVAAFDDNEE